MSTTHNSNLRKWAILLLPLAIISISSGACTFAQMIDSIQYALDSWANRTYSQPFPNVPTPKLGGSPTDPAGGGNSSGNLKPICFLNTGTSPATVMAWTYVPLNTETPAIPSNASTVASPGGNSSACLSLPLGTYTWCYHWELGDVNDDGYIDYAHAFNAPTVILDESDTDDLDLAERVTISPAAGTGEQPGVCDLNSRIVLDIRPYIVESQNIDKYYFGYSMIALAHNEDYVTLTGPITVDYYFHHCDAAPCTTPLIREPTVRVIIPAGEIHQFYLEDTIGDHLGNWDLFIQLVSIDG